MQTFKSIPIKDIPPKKKLGAKESKIPEILKQCIKGQALVITNTFTETPEHKWQTKDQPRIATIRSYLDKNHKKGQLNNIQAEQRTEFKEDKKITTLYIIKE